MNHPLPAAEHNIERQEVTTSTQKVTVPLHQLLTFLAQSYGMKNPEVTFGGKYFERSDMMDTDVMSLTITLEEVTTVTRDMGR